MAEITAQAVNELRKRTGLGLMECKALLQEAGGDPSKAATLAQEKGKIKAAGRSGRSTNAGRVEVAFAPDHSAGAIIELNCETDFVARNDEFRQAAKDLAEQVLAKGAGDLLEQPLLKQPDKKIKDLLTELNARTGENIALARAERFEGQGRVESYVHHDAKSGALVEVAGASAEGDALAAAARDVALHVVAMKPVAVGREAVSAEVVEEQKRIFATQVANQMADKPENVRDKIATGKLEAWFKENTLLDQEFVKDPSKKVRDVLTGLGKDVTVTRFARYVVGEGEAGAAASE